MPQVPGAPYDPTSGVAPQERPLRIVGIPDVPDAFGVGVARAISAFGGDVETGAEEVGRRAQGIAQMRIEGVARDQTTETMNNVEKIKNDFLAKEGVNAGQGAMNTALDQAEQERLQGRAKIQAIAGDYGAKLFDDQYASMQRSVVKEIGQHAATQFRESNKASSTAGISQQLAAIATARTDDQFNSFIGNIPNKVTEQQSLWGLSDASAAELKDRLTGMAWEAHLRQIGFNDPSRAQQLLEQNKEALRGVDKNGVSYYEKTSEWLQGRDLHVGAKNTADAIFSGISYDQALRRSEGTAAVPNYLTIKAAGTTAQGLAQFTGGTWSDVRAAHPELKLPPTVAAANEEQQTAALHAFTADNQQKLVAAGIPVNNQNTYMAHLLGAEGGIRFLNGLQANPDGPAYKLADPRAVDANRPIFYNRDGTARSAVEAYQYATRFFTGGPGPLTRDNQAQWLQGALDAADQASVGRDPQFNEEVRRQVINRYNQFVQVNEKIDVDNKNKLEDSILGGPGKPPITDFNQITGNPDLYAKYNALPPGMRNDLRKLVHSLGKEGVAPTPAGDALFWEMMGKAEQAKHDPAVRDELNHTDFSQFVDVLPREQVSRLHEAKIQVQNFWDGRVDATEKFNRLNGYLNAPSVKAMLDGAGIFASTTNTGANRSYLQFLGPFTARVNDFEKQHPGEVPDIKWLNETTSDLLLHAHPPTLPLIGVTYGVAGPANYTLPTANIPSDRAAMLQERFQRTHPGQTLTDDQLQQAYQMSLTDPDMRKRYGLGGTANP
jgi:hypothetical protein